MSMRFRPDTTEDGSKTKEQRLEERRALKPEVGGIVEYMGTRYVVVAVGNRICRMYTENGNPNFITAARLDMVMKVK